MTSDSKVYGMPIGSNCLALYYNNRGVAYANKQDYDHAIDDYDHATKINSRFTMAYNNRGWSFHQKGNEKRALDEIQKLTDAHMQKIDAASKAKEKEILEIR